ncbi:hypothetical protein TNCV_1087841 [Trichonephila clavipes]|uniref:Uncharacterized protein n=1 Tax=Trichonephila clavipes TaxID=2585209 RepID=A0A8X6SWZ8_TRICX|nr:hypothetical protein TNCV_1087841 [Trichonephila clavipes]
MKWYQEEAVILNLISMWCFFGTGEQQRPEARDPRTGGCSSQRGRTNSHHGGAVQARRSNCFRSQHSVVESTVFLFAVGAELFLLSNAPSTIKREIGAVMDLIAAVLHHRAGVTPAQSILGTPPPDSPKVSCTEENICTNRSIIIGYIGYNFISLCGKRTVSKPEILRKLNIEPDDYTVQAMERLNKQRLLKTKYK